MATLRELRKRQVMTQAELAEKAGVGRMTVVRLEKGQTDAVRPSTLRKLAKALRVRPQEIDLPPRA